MDCRLAARATGPKALQPASALAVEDFRQEGISPGRLLEIGRKLSTHSPEVRQLAEAPGSNQSRDISLRRRWSSPVQDEYRIPNRHAILTALTLRLVFRQTGASRNYLPGWMRLDLNSSDHTTHSRRNQIVEMQPLGRAHDDPINLVVATTALNPGSPNRDLEIS